MSVKRWKNAQSAEKTWWNEEWRNRKSKIDVFKLKTYWQHYINCAKKYMDFNHNYKILDIGCGPDGIINYINIGERYGLDPLMMYYLTNFKMPIDIKWIEGKAEYLPFDNNFFDLIFTTNALDHSRDPKKYLKEIYRCLKSNGYLYLTVDCYGNYSAKFKNIREKIGLGSMIHPHSFTKIQIHDLIKLAGFDLIAEHKGLGNQGQAIRITDYQENIEKRIYSKYKKMQYIKRNLGCVILLKTIIGYIISTLEGGYEGDIIFIAKKLS